MRDHLFLVFGSKITFSTVGVFLPTLYVISDTQYKNKIHGYYNLQKLKHPCLSSILIRREKREVFEQLPNVIQKNIYVQLSDEQASMHAGFSRGIAK